MKRPRGLLRLSPAQRLRIAPGQQPRRADPAGGAGRRACMAPAGRRRGRDRRRADEGGERRLAVEFVGARWICRADVTVIASTWSWVTWQMAVRTPGAPLISMRICTGRREGGSSNRNSFGRRCGHDAAGAGLDTLAVDW